MADYLLFGTEGCHLCEEAEQILRAEGLEFESLDIIDDEQWQTLYGLLIPVLRHAGSGNQLNWPFDRPQLQAFIAKAKQTLVR